MPEIPVEKIIRSRRRTIAIEITQNASVIVRAPLRMPDSAIASFVADKNAWITKTLEKVKARQTQADHAYKEGETFWFLGRPYPLHYSDDAAAILRTDRLVVPHRLRPSVQDALKRWYIAEAAAEIGARCRYFSMMTGYAPASIRISDARRRWGSCTAADGLNFTWRLVQAPLPVVDYVIVHELVHLRQHDHSKKFWAKVKDLMPDYAERRQWLRQNEWLLRI